MIILNYELLSLNIYRIDNKVLNDTLTASTRYPKAYNMCILEIQLIMNRKIILHKL